MTHPEDLDRTLAGWQAALAAGRPLEQEARYRQADGTYRWFLGRNVPLRDEKGKIVKWYGTLYDIEDRKRAEGALRKSEEEWRNVFENNPTRYFMVDAAGIILVVNPFGAEQLGYRVEELAGRPINSVFYEPDRAAAQGVISRCLERPGQSISWEHHKVRKDGKVLCVRGTARGVGRFELAEGGTIFLDEVGELSAETQIALLRVLKEREFERVGGNRAIRADVRVVAATNRDLQAAVAAGTSRSDLYYRLNVFPIVIPPLRERREDIPLLVEYFIDLYARKAGRSIRGVNKKSLNLLQSYSWPGNIRELQNVIERSVVVCEAADLSVDESWLSSPPSMGNAPNTPFDFSQKLAIQKRDD